MIGAYESGRSPHASTCSKTGRHGVPTQGALEAEGTGMDRIGASIQVSTIKPIAGFAKTHT